MMKTTMKTLVAAALTAAFIPVIQANAQYQPPGEDGITASPKVRQFLNERKASAQMAVTPAPATSAQPVPEADIAASPKVHQQLAEQQRAPAARTNTPAIASSRSVGYRATGDDGITASPKVREQLNARGAQIEIAPIK
jgi:hypothetical protein